MAAPMRAKVLCTSSLQQILKTIPTQWQVPVRNSRYGPMYLEATFRKEDLKEPLAEDDERQFRPIKAAANDEVSTSTYDPLIAKFTRQIVFDGNKPLAREVIDRTIERVKQIQLEKYYKEESEEKRQLIQLDPKIILYDAVENCKPMLKIQRVKRGGVIYQVPIPITPNYALFKSLGWLIEVCAHKNRKARQRVWDALAQELINASNNEGNAIKKKQELHRLCEANRAYAHYRWG